MTDWTRKIGLALVVVVVLVALAGWAFWGRDPGLLDGVLTAVVVMAGIGAANAVGKRATTKPAVMQMEAKLRHEEEDRDGRTS